MYCKLRSYFRPLKLVCLNLIFCLSLNLSLLLPSSLPIGLESCAPPRADEQDSNDDHNEVEGDDPDQLMDLPMTDSVGDDLVEGPSSSATPVSVPDPPSSTAALAPAGKPSSTSQSAAQRAITAAARQQQQNEWRLRHTRERQAKKAAEKAARDAKVCSLVASSPATEPILGHVKSHR